MNDSRISLRTRLVYHLPMTSRRRFLGTAAGGFLATSSAFGRTTRYDEVEARIARRDFKNLTKEDLPTPCMVVDLDIFERNLHTMADHCRKTGIHRLIICI